MRLRFASLRYQAYNADAGQLTWRTRRHARRAERYRNTFFFLPKSAHEMSDRILRRIKRGYRTGDAYSWRRRIYLPPFGRSYQSAQPALLHERRCRSFRILPHESVRRSVQKALSRAVPARKYRSAGPASRRNRYRHRR